MCFKYLVGISAKKEKKEKEKRRKGHIVSLIGEGKESFLKNRCEISRNNNHRSL